MIHYLQVDDKEDDDDEGTVKIPVKKVKQDNFTSKFSSTMFLPKMDAAYKKWSGASDVPLTPSSPPAATYRYTHPTTASSGSCSVSDKKDSFMPVVKKEDLYRPQQQRRRSLTDREKVWENNSGEFYPEGSSPHLFPKSPSKIKKEPCSSVEDEDELSDVLLVEEEKNCS